MKRLGDPFIEYADFPGKTFIHLMRNRTPPSITRRSITPPHYQMSAELILCDGVRGTCTVNGFSFGLEDRMVIYIPPGYLHSVYYSSGRRHCVRRQDRAGVHREIYRPREGLLLRRARLRELRHAGRRLRPRPRGHQGSGGYDKSRCMSGLRAHLTYFRRLSGLNPGTVPPE